MHTRKEADNDRKVLRVYEIMESIKIQGRSTLTDEQRLRIQANKEKAISRLKEKTAAATASKNKDENNIFKFPHDTLCSDTAASIANNGDDIKERIRLNREMALARLKGKASNASHNTTSKKLYGESSSKDEKDISNHRNSKNVAQCGSEICEGNRSGCAADGAKDVRKVNRRTFSAMCSLISKTRFVVDCGFHQQLQEVFKAIPSRLYGKLNVSLLVSRCFIHVFIF